MSRQSRGVQATIREGTGERYWYTLVGYIVASILGVAYMVIVADLTTSVRGIGASGAIVILVLGFYSILTYGALFKDNAYVRATHRWQHRWWYYILSGLSLPAIAILASAAFWNTLAGLVLAFMVFPVSTLAMNVAYIYNRHRYVGIP